MSTPTQREADDSINLTQDEIDGLDEEMEISWTISHSNLTSLADVNGIFHEQVIISIDLHVQCIMIDVTRFL